MVDTVEKSLDERSVRTRILETARHLFADRGFDGTSLQAVAEAVGIRKPSLLHHFPSKDLLREAVIEDLLGHWQQRLPGLLAATHTGKDRFTAGVGALLDYFGEDPSRARLILREMLDRPAEIRLVLQERLRPFAALASDYVRLGQQTGQVRPELDPDLWVIQVITMVLGSVALGEVARSLVGRAEEDATAQLRELVRMARSSLFQPRNSGGDS